MNEDTDYLNQFFEVNPTERASGIYTVSLGQSKLFTIDSERTYFEVDENGETLVEFAPELSEVDMEGEMEDPIQTQNSPPASQINTAREEGKEGE